MNCVLISEFAKRAGLSTDTVRFYVRKGLLAPATGMKGGSNPYQIFTDEHLEAARIIRMSQGLGFSLREIAALAAEYNAGGMTPARSLELMRGQLARLEERRRKSTRWSTIPAPRSRGWRADRMARSRCSGSSRGAGARASGGRPHPLRAAERVRPGADDLDINHLADSGIGR